MGGPQSAASSASTPRAPAAPHTAYPCFHPLPESQPVLPCLLRRLLQQGKASEALTLAQRHASAPHFPRSLEWLLFTALELEVDAPQRKG